MPLVAQQRVDHHRVGDGAGRDRAVGPAPGPVGPRGDLAALLAQDPTDRLDRVALGSHVVDERHDQRLRGSSSPAKKIVAAFRISLSSRSRRFSAFSRLDLGLLLGGRPGPGAGIDLGLDHPAAHGLPPTPSLLRHRLAPHAVSEG